MTYGGNWKEMFTATENNDIELVRYHLQMGIDVNYQHPEFMTTFLIESVQRGHYDIAKLLLEHGADPTAKEHFGPHTPLSMAKFVKNKEMVALIKEYLGKSEK